MKKKKSLLIKIGDFIVDFRYLFLCIFILLGIISLVNLNNVEIEYDITSYLSDETETKAGLELMEKEFGSLNELQVMIEEIPLQEALELKTELASIDHVASISFEDNENYYKENKALFVIELDQVTEEEKDAVITQIEDQVQEEKYFLYVENGEDQVEGMNIILGLAILTIIVVLLLTTESYFEIVLAFLVFGVSILLNMGSNFLFGKISYITEAIAIVLQLGLSLDYFIIFMNHYMKERNDTPNLELAVKKTVSKSIPEILASSLTTIAGLIALVFMQLKIGEDIGLVLSKGILCSLLTVIFLLPLLLMVFSKIVDKTKHKVHIPNINKLANFIVSSRKVLLPLFILVLVLAICIMPNYEYVYNIYSVSSLNKSDNQIALEKINDTFGNTNRLVVLMKNEEKDYTKELELANRLLENDKISKVTSIGNYRVGENVYLGSKVQYQEFAVMFNIPEEMSRNLFSLYMNSHQITEEFSTYRINLVDLLYFLDEQKENLPLSEEMLLQIEEVKQELESSISLLESPEYSRMILELKVPSEGEETFSLLDRIKEEVEKEYSEVKLVGESVSAKDLSDSFSRDNTLITVVTILFIAIILLGTFRSLGATILLIVAIEGSILINFSLATLMGEKIFFISYIIVSAIQMGATIDYAIVMTNRYLTLREKQDKKQALIGAIKNSFPTIATSGLILMIAGFLIGLISSSGVVSSIGLFLATGTLISVLITIFILPALLYGLDTFIRKTTWKKHSK